MAIFAIDLNKTQSLPHPDDKDDPTIWEIRALDSRMMGRLSDDALSFGVDPNDPEGDADVKMANNQLSYNTVAVGLIGWQNYKTPEGDDIAFVTTKRNIGGKAYDVVADDALRTVPGHVLTWLAKEIRAMNDLNADGENRSLGK